MRARIIKPGFFKNEYLGELDPLARLFFSGTWCLADKEGRLEDRPKKLKAEILPYDNCDAEEIVQSLTDKGFYIRYEVNGNRYIQIANFKEHQNPHPKEAPSLIPPPPSLNNEVSTESNGNSMESNEQVTEIPEVVTEINAIPSCTSIPSLTSSTSTTTAVNACAREEENQGDDKSGKIIPLPLDPVVAEVFTLYQNEIGIVSPILADSLKDAIDHYPRDWLIEAIKITALESQNNPTKRNFRYIEGILKSWRTKGFKEKDKPWEVEKGEQSGKGKQRAPCSSKSSKAGMRPSEADWTKEQGI